MPKILGVWSDIPDSTRAWHEDKHIPDTVSRLSARADHFKAIENPFTSPQVLNGQWLTLYNIPDTFQWEAFEKSVSAPSHLDGALQEARFDMRCYSEIECFQAKDFAGGKTLLKVQRQRVNFRRSGQDDVGVLAAISFQPSKDSHDDFWRWWRGNLIQELMRSPHFIRCRLYTIANAALLEEGSYRKQPDDEALKYFLLYEFNCEDLPWDILVEVAQSEGWRHYVEQDLVYPLPWNRVEALTRDRNFRLRNTTTGKHTQVTARYKEEVTNIESFEASEYYSYAAHQ